MRPRSHHLVHGALGGVIAGGVVALWFLGLDLARGEAFATPTILAGAVLQRDIAEATFGVLAGYTILHFGIFIALGAASAAGLSLVGIAPALRHGVVFGLGILNGVHYVALLISGAEMMTVLPVGHVILANLLGGMALMAYLHHAEHRPEPLGIGALREHPLLREGLEVGLIGAGAVAIWFLLFDVISGRPLYTPAALGSALFVGGSAGDVSVTIGLVAAYSVLHLMAFALVGVAFVWVSVRIEHTPGLWLLALMGFIVLEAGFVGVAGLLSEWVLGGVGMLAVLLGNAVAVLAMARWVWVRRPGLKEKLIEQPVTTMV